MDVMEQMEAAVPESSGPPARRGIRPELIMGIIAALAAALLLAVMVLCMPYFAPEAPAVVEDDPELIMRQEGSHAETSAVEDSTEPTGENAPPPTIPPDPNPFDRNDFQYNSRNYLLLQNLPSSAGVDVSAHQGVINWKKVAASGIEFAIIRLGFRGYESGKLNEDKYVHENLEGAAKAGLKVGAYFYSQALNVEEAHEEIEYMLEILGDHPLDMPIVLDWEIPTSNARTAKMDARTLTDIQIHFIREMTQRGYEPMVYFNSHQASNLYYLGELEEAPFWLALYKDRMTFPWKVEFWQYTDNGRVPGINGPVDMNVYMPD